MIGLIFFTVTSVGFLAAFVLLGTKGRAKSSPKVCAVAAVGKMVRLVGVSFGILIVCSTIPTIGLSSASPVCAKWPRNFEPRVRFWCCSGLPR